MPRYKITALKSVYVKAYIGVLKDVPLIRDNQGSKIQTPKIHGNAEREFYLAQGEKKEDIHILVDVATSRGDLLVRSITMPANIGDKLKDGEMLVIERTE